MVVKINKGSMVQGYSSLTLALMSSKQTMNSTLDSVVSHSLNTVKDYLWSPVSTRCLHRDWKYLKKSHFQESWMVTALQFIVLSIIFYLFSSLFKLGYECISQISQRRQSWTCCTKCNNCMIYCQRSQNGPSFLWIQICCNKICDLCLPSEEEP